MPTIPTENYLIAIQTLHDEGIKCIPARVAEIAGVSAPTVTEAIKRMARDGYVETRPDHEILLTEQGRTLVVGLMRRHRMVERWLTDSLGLDWATAHEEAHKLEHAISDEVAERIWASMGCPNSCPHGNPIVPPGQTPVPDPHRLRLRDVRIGNTVTLIRISELAEDNHDLMVFYESKGFRPGLPIEVVDQAPTNGPITVRVAGNEVALSPEMAGFLWVRPVDAPPHSFAPNALVGVAG